MTRGGKRTGAGRKLNATTKRTAETANKLAADGIMPLEILVESMREAWKNGHKETACTLAQHAAPYMHPRMSSRDPLVKLDGITGTLSEQAALVVAAATQGKISPGEAACLLQVFASQAKVREADELERRIAALEETHGKA